MKIDFRWLRRLRGSNADEETAALLDEVGQGARTERYLRGLWVSGRSGFFWMAALVVAGWMVYSLVASDHGLIRLWELNQRENDLTSRLSSLEEEDRLLQWELQEDGLMKIERPAREKFHMQRPGEIVFYFPRAGGVAAPVQGDTDGPSPGRQPDPSESPGGNGTAPR